MDMNNDDQKRLIQLLARVFGVDALNKGEIHIKNGKIEVNGSDRKRVKVLHKTGVHEHLQWQINNRKKAEFEKKTQQCLEDLRFEFTDIELSRQKWWREIHKKYEIDRATHLEYDDNTQEIWLTEEQADEEQTEEQPNGND